MPRVLLHHEPGPALRQRLASLASADLTIEVVPVTDRATLARLLPETEVLWHLLDPVTAAMIDAAPGLRLIQKVGVGVNTIDLDAARRRGIAVCNMPGTNTAAVAEMTLALMLAALRRIPWLDRRMRAGLGWSLPDSYADRAGELSGRTVGLIGMGAVPRHLAPILRAMGATVLAWNRSPRPDAPATMLPLDEVVAGSDIVSLHLPLAEDTRQLIDRRRLGLMRAGAVLVNTARGGLVDEPALIELLDRGHLAAAALDAVALEPIPEDHPLLLRDDVVVTPHIAWQTPETWARSVTIALENTRRLAAEQPLLHRVA